LISDGLKFEKVEKTWRAIRKSDGALVFSREVPLGAFLDDLYRFLRPDLYQYGDTPWSHLIGQRSK